MKIFVWEIFSSCRMYVSVYESIMQSSIVSGKEIKKECDDLSSQVEDLLNELLIRQKQQKMEEEEAEKVHKLQEEMERERQQRRQEEERRRREEEAQKQSARDLA